MQNYTLDANDIPYNRGGDGFLIYQLATINNIPTELRIKDRNGVKWTCYLVKVRWLKKTVSYGASLYECQYRIF